jgi:NitT/TauT family transport system substrate-binding protein
MAGEAKPGFYVAVAVVVLGLVGFAYYRYNYTSPSQSSSPLTATETTSKPNETRSDELEGKLAASVEIPDLGPAGTYQLQGDTLDVEISDWPGYAPLIVANGGLEPNPDSYFFRKYGFKLKITVSEAEAEAWQAINSGKNAVSVTTVDVLALYADQLKVEVPIQLDFSRGGDGILTRKDITSINQLKGKILTVAQFTESDFFIRFLAQEAGLEVKPLQGMSDPPDPERINLLFTTTAFDAADVFVSSLKNGDNMISGAVTWAPKTTEVPQAYPNQVRLLTSNRNLLVVADIVIVNAGFAKQHPRIVKGLVEGILMGVEEMRTDPERTLRIVTKAFATTPEEMRALLQDVHLSNHAENLLFFSSEPGQIGSFRDLYYSAVYAYGKEVIKNVVPPEKLVNRAYLEELARDGLFQGQRVTLGPSKNAEKTEILERDPLLTKQIRFYFEPNSTELDVKDATNQQALKDLTTLLKLAPGSYLLLRGHLDNSKVAEFKQRGEAFFRRQAVRAVEESKKRAESVKTVLIKQYNVDAVRLDTEGRGWDEPLPGAKSDENRRVEVLLFTLE